MTVPAGAQLSEDGQYWWDGNEWQPNTAGSTSANQQTQNGQLSEDGFYRWDGSEWQPVDQTNDQEGGHAARFDPSAFQNLFSLANIQSEHQAEDHFASLGVDLSQSDDANA
jgi:hypothetical protein